MIDLADLEIPRLDEAADTELLEELAADELGTEQGELTKTPPACGPCPDCAALGVLYATEPGIRHCLCPNCGRAYGQRPALGAVRCVS